MNREQRVSLKEEKSFDGEDLKKNYPNIKDKKRTSFSLPKKKSTNFLYNKIIDRNLKNSPILSNKKLPFLKTKRKDQKDNNSFIYGCDENKIKELFKKSKENFNKTNKTANNSNFQDRALNSLLQAQKVVTRHQAFKSSDNFIENNAHQSFFLLRKSYEESIEKNNNLKQIKEKKQLFLRIKGRKKVDRMQKKKYSSFCS